MVKFEFDIESGRWRASDRIPNFPTRETYLQPFEGHNLREPIIVFDSGGEVEDTEAQDKVLLRNGMKSWGALCLPDRLRG